MPFRHCSVLSKRSLTNDLIDKNGLRANIFLNNQQTYRGEWLNNQKHGHGILKHQGNQSIYQGEFVHDRKHGHGTLTIVNEQGQWQRSYVGQWKDNQWHGYGTWYRNDSAYYQGEFIKNHKSGWGKMVEENGDI